MATLICNFGEGIDSYVVHASYSVTPDPYPTGATISTDGFSLSNISLNSSITIYAKETTCKNGYSFPAQVYIKTSSSGTWNNIGYLQSSSISFTMSNQTMWVKVGPAVEDESYTTYGIRLRTGTGINSYSVKYLGVSGSNYTTATVSNSSASTLCWVRANTNLEVINVNYSNLYGSPFQFKEYDSSFSTVSKTFAANDAQVYSSGARYVKLFGTQTSYETYAINLRTGIGVNSFQVSYTNSKNETVTAKVSNSSASTVCYVKANSNLTITSVDYATNYASPYYQNEYNSSWEKVLGTASGNTIKASGTRYFRLVGTYVEPTYEMYFRCGTGVKNFTIYRGTEQVSINSSTSWTKVDLKESSKTVTIKTISHKDGYVTPDYVGFYSSSTATSPGGTISSTTGEFTIEYASNRQYAQVSATALPLFKFRLSDTNQGRIQFSVLVDEKNEEIGNSQKEYTIVTP